MIREVVWATYMPAQREHDVVNPSGRPLHCGYVVAPVAGDGALTREDRR